MTNKRVIRKVHVQRKRPLDDQLWPLVVALFLFGGFLAGTVLAYLHLDDPRWYANAWTWLIAIPLVIVIALAALAYTGNRFLRRTMQLAIILCAIFHIALFIVAVETNIFSRFWLEIATRTKPLQPKNVVKVPKYFSWQHNPEQRAQRDFEQPAKTKLPDPEPDVSRPTPIAQKPTVVQPQPRPILEPEEAVQPKLVKRKQTRDATPRWREQQSQLSRRASAIPQRPTQTPAIPKVQPRTANRKMVVLPRQSKRVHTPTTPPTPAIEPRPKEPQPNLQPTPTSIVRKAKQPSDQPVASSSPSVQRPSRSTHATPRADIRVAPLGAIARQTQPDAIQPNNTSASYRRTQATQQPKKAEQPPQEIPMQMATRNRAERQQNLPNPTLARTPIPVASQRNRVTMRSAVSPISEQPGAKSSESSETAKLTRKTTAARQAAKSSGTKRPVPDAGGQTSMAANPVSRPTRRPASKQSSPSMEVANWRLPGRQATAAKPLGAVNRRISPVASATATRTPQPLNAGSLATTRASSRPATSNSATHLRPTVSDQIGSAAKIARVMPSRSPSRSQVQPSLDALASSDKPPLRAHRVAQRAVSPTSVESPVPTGSSSDRPTKPNPAALVLTKAQVGIAGGTQGHNVGRPSPTASGQATISSAAAKRAKATQNVPAGPALAPHAATLTRTGRAGRLKPSATRLVNSAEPATHSGSLAPSQLAASSSAVLTHAASDAASGLVTAAKGTADVDVGPAMRIASAGMTRADGGGQPRRMTGDQHRAPKRADAHTAPATSIAANQIASSPAAPIDSGGGQPSGLDGPLRPQTVATFHSKQAAPALGSPRSPSGSAAPISTSSAPPRLRRGRALTDGIVSADTSQNASVLAGRGSRDQHVQAETGVADIQPGNAVGQTAAKDPAGEIDAQLALDRQRASETVAGALRDASKLGTPSAEIADHVKLEAGDRPTRAEVVQGVPGLPLPGGGTREPNRPAHGPPIRADLQAELAQLAGKPRSSGQPDAVMANSQGDSRTRFVTGLNLPRTRDRIGRVTAGIDEKTGTHVSETIRTSMGRALASQTGPELPSTQTSSSPEKRSVSVESLPGRLLASATNDVNSTSGPSATKPGLETLLGRVDMASVRRTTGMALPVDLQAVEGPGGIGAKVDINVGIPQRHARKRSTLVQLDAARFARRHVGGIPDFNAASAVAAEPFRRRVEKGLGRGKGGAENGPGPQTEEAIELGLVFLSRDQAPDGSWKLADFAAEDGLPQMASDTAATGLALLAFQGAGYHHRDFRYADVVNRGIQYLLRSQQLNGDLFASMDDTSNRVVRLYSHGIATLALTEAYGMTQDESIREPAQMALDFIVETQNTDRGGWRYRPGISSDTSVTGWMMMALKSGELANLDVKPKAYNGIRQWLAHAKVSDQKPFLFRYNPYAPNTETQGRGRKPTKTMTSVGLLMRLYLGWRRDNPNLANGARYLLETPPSIGSLANPQRDTYYWYYATQVMFHMGGDYWKQWNNHLHPLLVDTQIREGQLAGSWDPNLPVPDRWAAHAGRLYVTTMNLLSLEIHYRHLPLYEDTAR